MVNNVSGLFSWFNKTNSCIEPVSKEIYSADSSEDKILEELITEEIVNIASRINEEKIFNKRLPCFNQEEKKRLSEVLNSKCWIQFKKNFPKQPDYYLDTVMTDIPEIVVNFLYEKYGEWAQVGVVGGTAFDIFGASYCARAIKGLGSKSFTKINTPEIRAEFSEKSPDVDQKIFLMKITESDLEVIKERIIEIFLERFKCKYKAYVSKNLYKFVKSRAFTKLKIVNEGGNKFLTIGLAGGVNRDILIISELARPYLFSRDAIYIPLTNEKTVRPSGDFSGGWQAIISRVTKTIIVPNPENVNEYGWPLLISYLSRGYTLMEDKTNENVNAEEILRNTFFHYLNLNSEKDSLLNVITKVLANHCPEDKTISLFYLLNAFMYLKKVVAAVEMKIISVALLNNLQPTSSIILALKNILTESSIPFEIIEAHLVLAGNMRMMRQYDSTSPVEFVFRRYCGGIGLQMRVKEEGKLRTVMLPNDLKKSLSLINTYWLNNRSSDDGAKLLEFCNVLQEFLQIKPEECSRAIYFTSSFYEALLNLFICKNSDQVHTWFDINLQISDQKPLTENILNKVTFKEVLIRPTTSTPTSKVVPAVTVTSKTASTQKTTPKETPVIVSPQKTTPKATPPVTATPKPKVIPAMKASPKVAAVVVVKNKNKALAKAKVGVKVKPRSPVISKETNATVSFLVLTEEHISKKEWKLVYEAFKSYYINSNKHINSYRKLPVENLLESMFNDDSNDSFSFLLKVEVINNLCILFNDCLDDFLTESSIKKILHFVKINDEMPFSELNMNYLQLYNFLIKKIETFSLEEKNELPIFNLLNRANHLIQWSFSCAKNKNVTPAVKLLMEYVEPLLKLMKDKVEIAEVSSLIVDIAHSMYIKNYVPKQFSSFQIILSKAIESLLVEKNLEMYKKIQKLIQYFFVKENFRTEEPNFSVINSFKKIIENSEYQDLKSWTSLLETYLTFFPLKIEYEVLFVKNIFDVFNKNQYFEGTIRIFNILKLLKQTENIQEYSLNVLKYLLDSSPPQLSIQSVSDYLSKNDCLYDNIEFTNALQKYLLKGISSLNSKKDGLQKSEGLIVYFFNTLKMKFSFNHVLWNQFLSLVHLQNDQILLSDVFNVYLCYEERYINNADNTVQSSSVIREQCWNSILKILKKLSQERLALFLNGYRSIVQITSDFLLSPSLYDCKTHLLFSSYEYALKTKSNEILDRIIEILNTDDELKSQYSEKVKRPSIVSVLVRNLLSFSNKNMNSVVTAIFCQYFDDVNKKGSYEWDLFFISELIINLEHQSLFAPDDFNKLIRKCLELKNTINNPIFDSFFLYFNMKKCSIDEFKNEALVLLLRSSNRLVDNLCINIFNILNSKDEIDAQKRNLYISSSKNKINALLDEISSHCSFTECAYLLKEVIKLNIIDKKYIEELIYELFDHFCFSKELTAQEFLDIHLENFKDLFQNSTQIEKLLIKGRYVKNLVSFIAKEGIRAENCRVDLFSHYFLQMLTMIKPSFICTSIDCGKSIQEIFKCMSDQEFQTFEIVSYEIIKKILDIIGTSSDINYYPAISFASELMITILNKIPDKSKKNWDRLAEKFIYAPLNLINDDIYLIHLQKINLILESVYFSNNFLECHVYLRAQLLSVINLEKFNYNSIRSNIEIFQNAIKHNIQFLSNSKSYFPFKHAFTQCLSWFKNFQESLKNSSVEKELLDLLLESLIQYPFTSYKSEKEVIALFNNEHIQPFAHSFGLTLLQKLTKTQEFDVRENKLYVAITAMDFDFFSMKNEMTPFQKTLFLEFIDALIKVHQNTKEMIPNENFEKIDLLKSAIEKFLFLGLHATKDLPAIALKTSKNSEPISTTPINPVISDFKSDEVKPTNQLHTFNYNYFQSYKKISNLVLEECIEKKHYLNLVFIKCMQDQLNSFLREKLCEFISKKWHLDLLNTNVLSIELFKSAKDKYLKEGDSSLVNFVDETIKNLKKYVDIDKYSEIACKWASFRAEISLSK